MTRRHNLRRVHRNRAYSAPELAELLAVNLGTVRRWSMLGLRPIDRKRPFLYLGSAVAEWLGARAQPRQPLAPGELYCIPCKARRIPLGGVVRLIPRASTTVDFHGRCPVCGRELFRRVRVTEIGRKLGGCRIAYEDSPMTIRRESEPLQEVVSAEAAS